MLIIATSGFLWGTWHTTGESISQLRFARTPRESKTGSPSP
jgi:hypothetical protein